MVSTCREAYDAVLGHHPNQRDRLRQEVSVSADDLLDVRSTTGDVTEAGLRGNVSVALQYIETWLRGQGAVGINNMMEDAATAETSRCQVWQWINNSIELNTAVHRPDPGRRARRARRARRLLTLPAYERMP